MPWSTLFYHIPNLQNRRVDNQANSFNHMYQIFERVNTLWSCPWEALQSSLNTRKSITNSGNAYNSYSTIILACVSIPKIGFTITALTQQMLWSAITLVWLLWNSSTQCIYHKKAAGLVTWEHNSHVVRYIDRSAVALEGLKASPSSAHWPRYNKNWTTLQRRIDPTIIWIKIQNQCAEHDHSSVIPTQG